jgi:hypothetical protein
MKEMLMYIIIVLACITFGIHSCNKSKDECKKFAEKRDCTAVSIDWHLTTFNTPFFWKNRNTLIWEITLSNGETWFMRPCLLSNDEWIKNEKSK